mmetsp:Transcript_1258/g.1798  ORF Transcript_1258/g.1798 Transcript_1258/m.1798 type:complete len:195 (+) Transcript_1258:104-688(+)
MADDEIENALIFDSDKEREEEELLLVYAFLGYYLEQKKVNQRASFYVQDRLEWCKHVDELLGEGRDAFLRLYRMNYELCMKLCAIIYPKFEADEEMARVRTGKGPLSTERMLHCLLRWMGGGSYLDIRLCVGISTLYFYMCMHKCVDAILTSDKLSYSFPTREEEIYTSVWNFESLSSNGAIKGCVACIDGYLL